MGRNLVICIDGTNNDVASDETNVLRLFRALRRTDQQIPYYDAGIGTMADPAHLTRSGRWLSRKVDLAIGHSLRDNFCAAYRFLVEHYREGDRICVFGFSRGAYGARVLAGALHMLGLLRPEHENLVPYAWSLYTNDSDALKTDARFGGAARFKQLFSRDVRVHLVGVWDTVSSVGWMWDFQALPYTAHNPSIDHFRHAISIDEHRGMFRQNVFYAGRDNRSVKQVWFAGSHSDVGGGYPEASGGLSKVALRWMLREREVAALDLDPRIVGEILGGAPGSSAPDPLAEKHRSLTIGWWLGEILPRHTARGWHLPNVFRARTMRPEFAADGTPVPVLVHQSVKARMAGDPKYHPRNLRKCAAVTYVDDEAPAAP